MKFLGNDFSVLAMVHAFGMTEGSAKKKKNFNKYSFAPLIVYRGIGPEKRYHGNLKEYLLIDN